MKLIVMQDFTLKATLDMPMVDGNPELGTFSSATKRTFHKGEIIEADRSRISASEMVFLDTGYGMVSYSESVPAENVIHLTKRNRHVAYLFTRKMEEARRLENELLEAEFRVDQAAQEIPESDSVHDVMYFSGLCSRNQTYSARYQFRMDSVLNQVRRYERMLAGASMY